MLFDEEERVVDFGVSKQVLLRVLEAAEPFLTSGCPGCNRPFYNEKPSGPLYNYPRSVRSAELRSIKRDLKL
jgi:biotin synthase-related radical SAM superfamily protein